MDEIARLSDLHQRQKRQGPGGEAETRLALSLSGLAGRTGLRIADILTAVRESRAVRTGQA